MGILEDHLLDLHQPGDVAPLVLIQLHGDVADLLLELGDHHVLQGVDPAAGLLDVRGQQLHGLLHLGQLQHVLEHLGERLQGGVQLTAGLGEAVGVDLRGVLVPGVEAVDGDVDGHDVL